MRLASIALLLIFSIGCSGDVGKLAAHARQEIASGNAKDAIKWYDAAIEIDPSAELYNDRGMAYALAGDDVHALADFNHAIKLHPHAVTHLSRAMLYMRQTNPVAAMADLDEALLLDPGFESAWKKREELSAILARREASGGDF